MKPWFITFGTVFHELALKLRQPLIISYIITGIAVLLFVVGLKLDVGLIRSVGPVALASCSALGLVLHP